MNHEPTHPEAAPEGIPENSNGPTRVRWRVAIFATAVTAVAVLPVFMTGALAVQIARDLGLELAQLGALFGIYFGVSALGSAALGRVTEWRGWSQVLRLAAAGSAVTLLAIATVARSPWVIGAFFVLGGVSAAASQSSANLALARSVPATRYGLLFGFKHVAVPIATMLGGLAVPAFALTIGWRWAYGAAAALACGVAIGVPRARRGLDGSARDPARVAKLSTPVGTLALLAIAAALGIGGMDSLASFGVTYSVDTGMAESTAGILLAAGSVAGLTTRLIAGWLIDRRQHAGLPAIAALLAGGALGLTVLAAGGPAWVATGVLVAFAFGWGWSGLLTFSVVRANPEAPAAATGITHTGVYVGAAAGPPLFGLLAEHVSFAAAWWCASAALALSTVIVGWVSLASRSRPSPSLEQGDRAAAP
jgi:predicted MFS family arabinose efflux permease